jgi:hypothetical protein
MKSLNRKRFTQQGIERLRYEKAAAPPSGRIEIEDEACPGLLLRVTPRNLKSFSVIYRVLGEGGTSPKGRLLAGKQHRVTLGATPPLELTAARRQARDIIQAATEGRDLRTERREKHLIRSVNTFEVFKRFMEIEIIPNVEAWKSVDGVLRRHVLPHWGKTPVHDIRRSHIHELIDELVKQGKHGSAREVRSTSPAFSIGLSIGKSSRTTQSMASSKATCRRLKRPDEHCSIRRSDAFGGLRQHWVIPLARSTSCCF